MNLLSDYNRVVIGDKVFYVSPGVVVSFRPNDVLFEIREDAVVYCDGFEFEGICTTCLDDNGLDTNEGIENKTFVADYLALCQPEIAATVVAFLRTRYDCFDKVPGKTDPHDAWVKVSERLREYGLSYISKSELENAVGKELGTNLAKELLDLFFTDTPPNPTDLFFKQSARKHNLFTQKSTLLASVTDIRDGHEYVDMGLPSKTMWATCNVDAKHTCEVGSGVAWGELFPKAVYKGHTYRFSKGGGEYVLIYGEYETFCADGLRELQPCDDVATHRWGPRWHMPSKDDFEELVNNCSIAEIDDYNGTGVAGYLFTSKNNNNVLFLPVAADDVRYWTSQKSDIAEKDEDRSAFAFWMGHVTNYCRFNKAFVRPVFRY